MPQTPHIIYVGLFRFPDGDAGAARVRGIGMALREAGYRVAFAGWEAHARPQDLQSDGSACWQGFEYYPAELNARSRAARWRRGFGLHITGQLTLDRLQAHVGSETRAIVAYNMTSPLLWRLISYCKKRGLALIADCPEWYDPHHVWGGPWGPLSLDSELRMRWLLPKIGRIIAISSYLERYYVGRGCQVTRVPPLVDIQSPCWRPLSERLPENPALNLAYAGTPGKKDLIVNALRAVVELRREGIPLKLHLIGSTRENLGSWLREEVSFVDELGDTVVYHGRVSQERVYDLVSQANFTILLRENKRYANAGFPTKLVESLSAGTPIITNLTSDIGECVCDGREGILLKDASSEAFKEGVKRALRMPRARWYEMRTHARHRAEERFDYRRYITPLKDFFEQVCQRNEKGIKHG